MDWAELARDIRNAHSQLVASFGSGVIFDGKDWEEQRNYLARTLYYKWMGLQASHGISGANDGTATYMGQYWTQTVSGFRYALGIASSLSAQETSSQLYGELSHGVVDPSLTTFQYTFWEDISVCHCETRRASGKCTMLLYPEKRCVCMF